MRDISSDRATFNTSRGRLVEQSPAMFLKSPQSLPSNPAQAHPQTHDRQMNKSINNCCEALLVLTLGFRSRKTSCSSPSRELGLLRFLWPLLLSLCLLDGSRQLSRAHHSVGFGQKIPGAPPPHLYLLINILQPRLLDAFCRECRSRESGDPTDASDP